MWFVSCGCVTTVWCVGSDFAEDTNDWQVIIFLLTRYVNDFYVCGNVGSALLHLTQFVLIVSSSDTETALGYVHISFSLRTQRTRLTSEQIWAQTKLQSHISSYCKCHTLASFPMSLSLFWIWRKSEQRKKGSKTTAQGVYRLLDDLRSCYEAVCGFSLGARLWVQPAACCGEAAKPKFTFVCACVPMQMSSVLRGVIDYRCERLDARHRCFESVRNVIFQKEFKEKWDVCVRRMLFETREAGMTPFSTTVLQTACFSLVAVPN